MPRLRILCLLTNLALAPGLWAAEPPLDRFAIVEVEPVKTSVYVGSVRLTAERFARHGQIYSAGYTAKVSPYFFYNEDGRLDVAVSDSALRTLDAGSPIDFKGTATRADGRQRLVECRAIPADSTSGKLKVRIVVNHYITLIFNTTYRLSSGGTGGAK